MSATSAPGPEATQATAGLVQELRKVPVLADLSDAERQWLAEHLEPGTYEAGELIARAGDPVEHLLIVLEGEIQSRPDGGGPNLATYIASAGQITGLLPQSRMTKFMRTTMAAMPTRVARLHKKYFDEMLAAIPQLGPKLFGVMADRIRNTTKVDVQSEKLAALGKLSAGLAHELNNPAAAARNAAGAIRELLDQLRASDIQLASLSIPPETWSKVAALEELAMQNAGRCTALDSLTRSDREEQLGDLLSRLNIPNAWDLTPALVDAGLDTAQLNEIATMVGASGLGAVLVRLASILGLYKLSDEVQESTTRISDLVRAVKEYSWMDTVPERDIDIHAGIENTLTILKHRLRGEVRVERRYDPALPLVCAHGGELNQIWTNLLNNAIDAMSGIPGEKVLLIRTATQADGVLVEITDSGPGIPEEIQDHIFEPFFTTKPQDVGTGLGLDAVQQIVRKHHGDIRFQTRPGRTCFQVRLPLRRPNVPK